MNGAVYGQSLYLLAREEGLEEEILQQVKVLAECFEVQPDYLKLLASHDLPKQERLDILHRDFGGKVHGYVLNFLKLLTEKGYIRQYPECIKAYTAAFNADRGILEVRAVSAVALTDDQKAKLRSKLTAMTGKTVELCCKVDAAVMGGVRLQFDGRQVDGTVRNYLQAMEKALKNIEV